MSFLFLGSRMKRLAERMQADALQIFRDCGHDNFASGMMPILATLDRDGPVGISHLMTTIGISQPAITRSVSQMKAAGYVTLVRDQADQRQKIVSLTPQGLALTAMLKGGVWPRISASAENLLENIDGPLLDQMSELEARLIERPLYKRITSAAVLEIIPYEDTLAQAFYDLNEAWISSMFKMEMADEAVLSDPRGKIIERGGHILFVKAADGAVIGAGALQPVGEDGDFELTKMAVDESRRGEKAGEFLLAALIEKARSIGVKRLHLLTNTDCRAAIHLYEKLGFTHDANIMAQFGAKYDRADVAMRYPI